MSDWLHQDNFTIGQLIRPMVNLYRISAGPVPVAFVRQKRMAIKEDIRFFADESEAHELWRIKARSVMEFGGRYDVVTPEGEQIGVLGKVFGKSLFRSTWSVMDANEQELAIAKERRSRSRSSAASSTPCRTGTSSRSRSTSRSTTVRPTSVI